MASLNVSRYVPYNCSHTGTMRWFDLGRSVHLTATEMVENVMDQIGRDDVGKEVWMNTAVLRDKPNVRGSG